MLYGVAGAKQLGLFRIAHAVAEHSLDLMLTVPDHDDGCQVDDRPDRVYRPLDHGAAEQRVHDFRQGRLHTGAVAGGENHSSSGHTLFTKIWMLLRINAGAPIEKGLQHVASPMGVQLCDTGNRRQRRQAAQLVGRP